MFITNVRQNSVCVTKFVGELARPDGRLAVSWCRSDGLCVAWILYSVCVLRWKPRQEHPLACYGFFRMDAVTFYHLLHTMQFTRCYFRYSWSSSRTFNAWARFSHQMVQVGQSHTALHPSRRLIQLEPKLCVYLVPFSSYNELFAKRRLF